MDRNNTKNSIKRILSAALVAIILVSSSLMLFGCSRKGALESDAFVKIKNKGEKIAMQAPVSNDKRDVYLFAINTWDEPTEITNLEPLAKAKVKHREAKASYKVEDGELYELLCKGFVFGMENSEGVGYTPVSDVYYVSNPKEVHKNGSKINEAMLVDDLKGLVGTPSQLLELGARSTMITVDLGDLILEKGGEGAYSFVFNGVSVHVDRNALDALDREVKAFAKSGISVYFEIVQTKSHSELSGSVRDIAFELPTGARGYALNMQSREGGNAICGVLDLLSERYSSDEFGHVDAFIIGRRVNDFARYYASGLDTEEAVQNYSDAVRMAYNLLLAHNPDGKVYIALGNNWGVSETGGISAKSMLTAFTSIAENGGDYFWQISIEANASDSSNSAIWRDNLTTEGASFISPANLDVLTVLLSTSGYKCNGYERNMILNRLAIGGANGEEQAASYAYAYYKALSSEKVNAIIYSSAIDSESNTVSSGLYSVGADGMPAPKKLASIFDAVDNKIVGDISYVSNLLGDSWSSLYSPLSKKAVNRRVMFGSPSQEHGREEIAVLALFENGNMHGFTPIGADYAELRYADSWRKPSLYAALAPSFAGDKAGVITDTISLDEIKDAGYLALTSMPVGRGDTVLLSVRLSGYDKDGIEVVYQAEGDVKLGEWVTSYYEIEDYIRHVKSDTLSLSITVASKTDDDELSGLWISKISVEEPTGFQFPFWILWVLLGVVVVGGLTVFVIWFRKNYTFVRE